MAHKEYPVVRSLSRVATLTGNPIMEALKGWIKEELYLDFDLRYTNDLLYTLDRFVAYYNHDRLASALGHKSPVQFMIEQGLGLCL